VNGELKDVEESNSGPVWHEAPNLPGRIEETYEYKQKKTADPLDKICTEDFQNTKQECSQPHRHIQCFTILVKGT
jgi:hypothetical protein